MPPLERCSGLELEIVRYNSCEDKMFINVFSLPIPEDKEQPDKAKVIIAIDGIPETVLADRFIGGQRLLLDQEAALKIINALLECRQVTIAVSRYQADITTANFYELFNKL